MEIVKARETSICHPAKQKPLGRSSFVIKLYLGFTYNCLCIHNTPVNYLLIGSSNVDQQWFPNIILLVSLILLLLRGNGVPEATVVILSISMWQVIIDQVCSFKVPSQETSEKILALRHYEKMTSRETILSWTLMVNCKAVTRGSVYRDVCHWSWLVLFT